MKIVGCDLHARQQSIALLDCETGELVEQTITHEGDQVREFYSKLEGPVVVGIEATGSMQWFLELMEELGIECRVGHPAKIRAGETRKQKHDRRDARLILQMLIENRFPTIWMPSIELRDLRTLLRDRHQWVRIRSRAQSTLQSIALNHGLRKAKALWTQAGIEILERLPLPPYTSARRSQLLGLYRQLQERIDGLNREVEHQVQLVQKGMGKARVAAARKLGIRLWIILRDQIDYEEFCRRGRQKVETHAGMPATNNGPGSSVTGLVE